MSQEKNDTIDSIARSLGLQPQAAWEEVVATHPLSPKLVEAVRSVHQARRRQKAALADWCNALVYAEEDLHRPEQEQAVLMWLEIAKDAQARLRMWRKIEQDALQCILETL